MAGEAVAATPTVASDVELAKVSPEAPELAATVAEDGAMAGEAVAATQTVASDVELAKVPPEAPELAATVAEDRAEALAEDDDEEALFKDLFEGPPSPEGAEEKESCSMAKEAGEQAAGDTREAAELSADAGEEVHAPEAMPSRQQLASCIAEVMAGQDVTTFTLGQLRNDLERRLGMSPSSLDPAVGVIKKLAKAEINRIIDANAGVEGALATPAKTSAHGRKRARRDSSEDWGEDDMTRSRFRAESEKVVVHVGEKKLKLPAKVFDSGNCGFWANDMIMMNIGGQLREVHCQVHCHVVGSKQWKD